MIVRALAVAVVVYFTAFPVMCWVVPSRRRGGEYYTWFSSWLWDYAPWTRLFLSAVAAAVYIGWRIGL